MKNILYTFLVAIVSINLSAQTKIFSPILVSPNEDNQMPDVILDWYPVSGIGEVYYEAQLDFNDSFTSPDLQIFETTLSSVQTNNLLFGNKYYWRVKAWDDNDTSAWSEIFSFTVFKRIRINKPDDGKEDRMPDVKITWYNNLSGTTLSGITYFDCQFDTSYYWSVSEDIPTEENLYSLYFLDESNGWVVGSSGTILFNNGTEWTEQTSPTSNELNSVNFFDENNGWAVGEGGIILYYDGNEWTTQSSPATEDLYAVYFTDVSNGWAVGEDGIIYYYNGTEWTEQTCPSTKDLYAVFFTDQNNGWAAGKSGKIYYYDGTEWTEQTSPSSKDIYSLSFLDENNGWASGKAGNLLYYDGSEWAELESNSTADLNSIFMLNQNEGWAGGKDGLLVHFDGNEWLELTSSSVNLINSIFMLDADNAWLAGDMGTIVSRSGDAFNSPIVQIRSTIGDSSEIQMAELLFDTKYFWRVRARHEEDTSSWSSVQYFKTIDVVNLEEPANGATEQMLDVTLRWEKITGIFEYIYEFGTDPNFSFPSTNFSQINEANPQGLLFGTTYYWHVKAAHTKDTTEWSDTWSFETINTVYLTSPGQGDTVVITLPILEWEDLTGISAYEVQYDTSINFNNAETYNDIDTSRFQVIFPLETGKTYYWHVRAYEDGDTTNWSDTWHFFIGSESGIEDLILNKNNVNIFPNPSQGKLSIELNAQQQTSVRITISDLLGQAVINNEYSFDKGLNTKTIDLSDMNNGIYIIKLQSGEIVLTEKIVIDK